MLQFMRNKLISVAKEDNDTLSVWGILDDDLYGLEVKIRVNLSELKILSIEGKWNRWTTPECWRAIDPLQEAVGMCIERGLRQKIQKTISRKACRHYANILLECCHAAREASLLLEGELPQMEQRRAGVDKPICTGPATEKRSTGLRTQEKAEARRESEEQFIETNVSKGMIIDLHVHTYPASPCSSAHVDEVIEEAKRIGLDGICLTDHNHLWDEERINKLKRKHGFLVFRGNEITTDQGDILVFGLERDIQGIIKLEELREAVIEIGGFMITAHPFRGFLILDLEQFGLTPEKAMERKVFKYVDALEVMNSKATETEKMFTLEVAQGLGMPGTGGSDAHEVRDVGIYATRFFDTISNEQDLIDALRSGNCRAIAFRDRWPGKAGLEERVDSQVSIQN